MARACRGGSGLARWFCGIFGAERMLRRRKGNAKRQARHAGGEVTAMSHVEAHRLTDMG